MGGSMTWNKRDVSRYGVVPLMWPWTMTLTLDSQGQILKRPYPRNGMADGHGTKVMGVDRKSFPLCNFGLWPHPWPWLWIFKVKFSKSHISGMEGLIDKERKGCKSNAMLGLLCNLELWTQPWIAIEFLDFQGQIFEIVAFQEWMK